MPSYDTEFFRYVNSGAIRSARSVLPHLIEPLGVGSVLDVGCGQGAWLSVWRELGVAAVAGLDGDYVERDSLLVDASEFHAHDLSRPFSLGRRFDIVQCLEVAEHLPTASSAGLVASLVEHGDIVLFSAAPKGQGGDNHINEQDYEFWRAQFAAHDYVAVDYLRPRVIDDTSVEPWYRFNTFIYVGAGRLAALPAPLRAAAVPDDRPLADLSPALYQFRKSLVRLLPVPVMTGLAKIKERVVSRSRAGG
ncbi:MAG: methyltransferase domain-containing protein [Pseudomonadota bacterium]